MYALRRMRQGGKGAGGTRRGTRTFAALFEVPALRWYFASMVGNWSALQMQQVVRGYLAFHLTGSYAALGGVALANSLPRLALSLFAGVVADRASRRHVMQVSQGFNLALTGVIAALLFADALRLEHLLITAALHGVANVFSQPARLSLLPDLVGPQRLTNAIGLNVSVVNVVRLTAPAIAGFLLAWFGGAWVYVLMTVLYGLSILAMFPIPSRRARPAPEPPEPPVTAADADPDAPEPDPAPGPSPAPKRGAGGVLEALRYLRGEPTLILLLSVHLVVGLLSHPFQRLLPGFVAELLAADEREAAWRLGLLFWFMGAGALAGSLVVASLSNRRRGALLLFSLTLFGAALIGFSVTTQFALSAVAVVLLGVGMAGRQSLSHILIQTHVSDAFRGRISSIMMLELAFDGVGVFAISLVAGEVGIQPTLFALGLGMLLLSAAVAFFLPAYRKLQ